MTWVRMHSLLMEWPGGGPAPSFDISSDENGAAVVELAWDPQALLAPASYTTPLRYYSSAVPFIANITNDDGSARAISVPAQTIALSGNRASWTIPTALWEGYVEESFKTMRTPRTTTFALNLYYRVRLTPPGASSATIWPSDAEVRIQASRAPHLSLLRISAVPGSQVAPDMQAVQAMGQGAVQRVVLPTLLLWFWNNRPESDPHRRALAAIFAHQNFRSADLSTRAGLLQLWLFAGPARPKVPQLLGRGAVVGSGIVQPIVSKVALRGGKTLVGNLLDLLTITPHPDLLGVRTSEQLVDDVITEILDPNGQLNQGMAGTCSPTSIQTLLITVNPAEYARLMTGLLSAQASAVLANGTTVMVPPTIFQAPLYLPHGGNQAFVARTDSELAFQAAILRFGQGTRFPALAGTPQANAQAFLAVINGGFTAAETKRALDGIFGVNFTTNYIPQTSLAADQTAQPGIRTGFLRDLPGRQQQMILSVYWGAPYATPSPPGGGHVVMAVRRDQAVGRVFYKNPQYAGSAPVPGIVQGANGTNPPRRWEDPTQALESITEGDLSTWIKGYWVPDTAII